MGVDDPKSSVSAMNGSVMPNTRTSGGEMAPLPSSTVVKQPYDLSGITRSLEHLSGTIIDNIAKQKKEQEDLQRSVEYTRLTTESQLDGLSSYDGYKETFQGSPDTFASGFTKIYDQYSQTRLQGIQDPKLRARYEEFSLKNRAQLQLRALQDQSQIQINDFSNKFTDNNARLQELVRRSPDFFTLDEAINRMEGSYAEMMPLLKREGKDQAVIQEARSAQSALATTMIMSQAKDSPDSALASLDDPALRRLLDPDGTHPERLDSLTNTVLSIKEHRNRPLMSQAHLAAENYSAALAVGKDGSELRKQIGQLAAMGPGIVSEEDLRAIAVADRMAPMFGQIRDNLISLSDEQFDNAVAALDPAMGGGPADVSLQEQLRFYGTAVSALKSQRALVNKNPMSAMSALTGSTDPTTLAAQTASAKVRSGAKWSDVNVLDEKDVKGMLGKLDNAYIGGKWDQLAGFLRDIRSQYGVTPGHPERQVMPGVGLDDVVLSQLNRSANSPLTRRVIAAYHLLPKDQPIDDSNSLLLKAALMSPEERRNMIMRSGNEALVKANSLNPLDKQLIASSPVWRAAFAPSRFLTPADAQLQQAQKSVALDAILMNMSTGNFKPTGGIFGIGQTSAEQNAIDATIKSVLHLSSVTVEGNPAVPGEIYQSPELFGQRLSVGRKDWRMNFLKSELVIPQQYGEIPDDQITGVVSRHLLDDKWVFDNVLLPGYNDQRQGTTGKWPVPKAFTDKVGQIASRLGMDPDDLMGVMKVESGLRPNAVNSKSSATGLIQWMPFHFDGKKMGGLTREQFSSLSGTEQLDHVEAFLSPHKGRLNSPGKAYLAVAAPAVLQNLPANAGPDTVVYPAGSKAAKANPGWQDKTGAVRLGTLDALVRGAKKGASAATTRKPDYSALDAGKKQLLTGYLARIRQNIRLENSPSKNGFIVLTSADKHGVPILAGDGKPLEFTWEEVIRSSSVPRTSAGSAAQVKKATDVASSAWDTAMDSAIPGLSAAKWAAGKLLGGK